MHQRRYFFDSVCGIGMSLSGLLLFCGCGGSENEDQPLSANKQRFQVEQDAGGPGMSGDNMVPAVPAGPPVSPPSNDNNSNVLPQNPSQPAANPGQRPPRSTPPGVRPSSPATQPPPSVPAADLNKTVVPEGDHRQLLAFIRRLRDEINDLENQPMSAEAMMSAAQPKYDTLLEAAEKLLDMEIDDETQERAVDAKLGALIGFVMFQTPGAADRVRRFADELYADENSRVKAKGLNVLVGIRSAEIATGNDTDFEAYVAQVKELIASDQAAIDVFGTARQAANALRDAQQDDAYVELIRLLGETFINDEEELVAGAAKANLEIVKLIDLEFNAKTTAIANGDFSEVDAVMEVARTLLTEPPVGLQVFNEMGGLAQTLEEQSLNRNAAEIYGLMVEAPKEHLDEQLAEYVQTRSQMGAKKNGLVGRPFQIEANHLDGTPFDGEARLGKVVLVSLWATQDLASREEITQLRELYEKFNSQGLDIVGYSLDQDLETLEQFLADQELPWTTVVAENPGAQTAPKMFEKCGYPVIPFLVLVNQQGIAEGLNLRGDLLEKKITELLTGELTGDANQGDSAEEEEEEEEEEEQEQEAEVPESSEALEGSAGSDEVSSTSKNEAGKNPYLAPPFFSLTELVDFLLDMKDKSKSIQARKGYSAAVVNAADRVLSHQPGAKYEQIAILEKLRVLHDRAAWGDTTADEQLWTFVTTIKDDPREKIAEQVRFFQLERRVAEADDLSIEAIPTLLAELKDFFAGLNLHKRHLRMASLAVAAINRLEDAAVREKYFTEFGGLFAESESRELARYGRTLAKRPTASGGSDWIGKPLELTGATTLGVEFDWARYRGKIVLVDFWATWCGPCRAAMPHVKMLHQQFSQQSFDVVGVSLDQDLEVLSRYLDQNQIGWANLAGPEAQDLAAKYGIRGIPTMLLIDKEGTIVAVSHHLADLEKRLKSLLSD